MLKVRDEYEKIFYEIEGPNSDTKLEWPSKENTICLPKFVSKRSAGREQITENNTSNKSSQLIKDMKEVNSSTAAKSQDNELVLRTENKPSGGGVESEIDFEQIKYLQLENLKNMDKNELLSIREGISLELLWIEQAIQSRVQVSLVQIYFIKISF